MIKTSGYRVSPTEVEEADVCDRARPRRGRTRHGRPGGRARIALVVIGSSAMGSWRPSDVIGALRRELPLYMVPATVDRARRDTPFAEREVRPNAPSRAAHTMSDSPHDLGFGVANDAARDWRRPGGAPGRAGRHDAVLCLRPAASRRPRRAAPHDAAGRDRPELRRQGEPDARRRPAPLSSLVDCFDVASAARDAYAGSTLRCRAMRISFAGPGKTPAELSQAVAAGVTVDPGIRERRRSGSSDDRERASASGHAWLFASTRTSASRGTGMRMGGGPQQFGIDAEQVPELLRRPVAGRRSRSSAFTYSPGRRTSTPRSSARRSARRSSS